MILSPRMQGIFLKVDGKRNMTQIFSSRFIDKGYGYFMLDILTRAGLVVSNKVGTARIYSLTPIGKKLQDILSSLPELSHEWKWSSHKYYLERLKKKNAKFLIS